MWSVFRFPVSPGAVCVDCSLVKANLCFHWESDRKPVLFIHLGCGAECLHVHTFACTHMDTQTHSTTNILPSYFNPKLHLACASCLGDLGSLHSELYAEAVVRRYCFLSNLPLGGPKQLIQFPRDPYFSQGKVYTLKTINKK